MTFTKGKHQNNLTETLAIRNGNRNAFNGLYQRLHQKLYFYVLKQTSSAYIAEEIVQITFIKLWEYRASLSDAIAIDSQVFRIAKTSLIDLLRKRATERKSLPGMALLPDEQNDAIACLKYFYQCSIKMAFQAGLRGNRRYYYGRPVL